jgi:hypothetical protein
MDRAGRFEEKGHDLCRRLIRLLAEDDVLLPTSMGVGYAMMVVAFSWGLASPVIYGGRALDRLLGHDPNGVDASTFSFDPLEPDHTCPRDAPCWEGEGDPEVPAVVVDI